jgi:hypothetical protein
VAIWNLGELVAWKPGLHAGSAPIRGGVARYSRHPESSPESRFEVRITLANSRKNAVDPESVMSDYFDYVRQYRAASAALNESADLFWPRLQTRGLLIELALKTYLCATGRIADGHDLEALARLAVDRGLGLSAVDWTERITRVNEIYFSHIGWNAKYLARYPMPNREMGFWITPGHAPLDEMIARIIEQASARWSER